MGLAITWSSASMPCAMLDYLKGLELSISAKFLYLNISFAFLLHLFIVMNILPFLPYTWYSASSTMINAIASRGLSLSIVNVTRWWD